MNNDDFEYGKYMVVDALKYAAYAAIVYAVCLGAYWLFIG